MHRQSSAGGGVQLEEGEGRGETENGKEEEHQCPAEGGHLQGEMKKGRKRLDWYENMELVKKRRKP